MIYLSGGSPLAANPHSWDFLLLRMRGLSLPLLREIRRVESDELPGAFLQLEAMSCQCGTRAVS